jgi:hypothetical protein
MASLCGCIGYQNIKTYERIDNEIVLQKQVKAYIFGTSGQKIQDKDITIEKNDAVDKATSLLQAGLSTAKEIAINRSSELLK